MRRIRFSFEGAAEAGGVVDAGHHLRSIVPSRSCCRCLTQLVRRISGEAEVIVVACGFAQLPRNPRVFECGGEGCLHKAGAAPPHRGEGPLQTGPSYPSQR